MKSVLGALSVGRWTGARLLTAVLSASVAGALRISARQPRRSRWWRSTRALVGGQPALALGGAFLLGVATARRLRAPHALPSLKTADPMPAAPSVRSPRSGPDALQAADPIPREAPETTGVGSPIGDAPYASGSRY